MSTFDPDTFMSMTSSEANSTKVEPVPEGEYLAIIEGLRLRQVNDRYPLDVTYLITDPDLQSALGRDKITVRQTLWLDMTPNNTLDHSKGKNVGLGKLRAALDMNTPGKPFSVGMLQGAGPLRIEVKHSPDKNDPENVYSNVVKVGKP